MPKVMSVADFDTIDPRGRACVYTGETVDKVPHGKGVLTVVEEGPNKGNAVNGQFKSGKVNGQGSWRGASGSTYEGSWKNGEFHGVGTFTWADGSKYVGSFMDDKFHGRGTRYNADGSVECDGLWWNDDFLSSLSSPVSVTFILFTKKIISH
jgi:hypothetical protein